MVAFAGNSVLCRLALRQTGIDAASFTFIRLAAGALVLGVIALAREKTGQRGGSWVSALALFGYAAGFSFAYVRLPTAVGALLLFGAVQATMIGYGLRAGERFHPLQLIGLSVALGGMIALLMPGLTAPPAGSALLMIGAGVAWGIYSLRGREGGDPVAATAGNFLRALPLAVALGVAVFPGLSLDGAGVLYAVVSGALASGVGYAVWYAAVPGLTATTAATVQLSVPVIAAAGGIVFLGEAITVRLLCCSGAVLGGIALVTSGRRRADVA